MNPEFAVDVRSYVDRALQATRLTSQGPPPAIAGGVLSDPELLWVEDEEWDEERELSAEARIQSQGVPLSSYWRDKYVSKAGTYWTQFYKRNTDHFYKDRHYLHVEFPELLAQQHTLLLEVGCGVGNAVLPLLELSEHLHVYAVDFASSAIDILKQHPFHSLYAGRLMPSVCDVIHDALPVPSASLDLVLCMFVLSAISPELQLGVLQKLSSALKPGGKLLFRDYGRYDEAQLRFKKGSKLDDNLYVRCDGTLAYYFEQQELDALCSAAGLQAISERCSYVRRQMANRKQKQARYRIWIQACYEKSS